MMSERRVDPESRNGITRRFFVAGFLGVVGVAVAGWRWLLSGSSFTETGELRTASVGSLPGSVRETLEAASSRLLPSAEGEPGAREAGVIRYIERALQDPYWSGARKEFLEGVERLDRVAQFGWETSFVRLEEAQQDIVIRQVQAGGEDDEGFSGEAFLHDLLVLTMEGFLGDPVHGGNRNEVGWSVIGYVPGGPRPGSCSHRAE
jgi:hypothetical protein